MYIVLSDRGSRLIHPFQFSAILLRCNCLILFALAQVKVHQGHVSSAPWILLLESWLWFVNGVCLHSRVEPSAPSSAMTINNWSRMEGSWNRFIFVPIKRPSIQQTIAGIDFDVLVSKNSRSQMNALSWFYQFWGRVGMWCVFSYSCCLYIWTSRISWLFFTMLLFIGINEI